jgi:hypothetical protein
VKYLSRSNHVVHSLFILNRWRIDEPEGLKTFRLGLFGLDKMGDIPKCVGTLRTALDAVLAESGHTIPEKKVA